MAKEETPSSAAYENSPQARLDLINAHWRMIERMTYPRRRRFEEIEGSGEESYESKKEKYMAEVDKPHRVTTLGRTIKRRGPPPTEIFEVRYVVDEPEQETPPNHQGKAEELLDEDPTALQAFGSLVLQIPLHFEFIKSGAKLETEQLEACFKLVKKTSSADYKAAKEGWNPRAKLREMTDDKMMYLLVKTKTKESSILGFISFMLTHDELPYEYRSVVYMYEVHLDDRLRGCGLGSRLITFVELLASRFGVTKTMLTVFRTNTKAKALYERLGYSKDDASPADKVTRRRVIKADYIIMSKMWHNGF